MSIVSAPHSSCALISVPDCSLEDRFMSTLAIFDDKAITEGQESASKFYSFMALLKAHFVELMKINQALSIQLEASLSSETEIKPLNKEKLDAARKTLADFMNEVETKHQESSATKKKSDEDVLFIIAAKTQAIKDINKTYDDQLALKKIELEPMKKKIEIARAESARKAIKAEEEKNEAVQAVSKKYEEQIILKQQTIAELRKEKSALDDFFKPLPPESYKPSEWVMKFSKFV